MAPKNSPFKPGDAVETKAKPNKKGVILQAVPGGVKHLWEVEFVREDGSIYSEHRSSKQLKRPVVGDDDVANITQGVSNLMAPPQQQGRNNNFQTTVEEEDITSVTAENDDMSSSQSSNAYQDHQDDNLSPSLDLNNNNNEPTIMDRLRQIVYDDDSSSTATTSSLTPPTTTAGMFPAWELEMDEDITRIPTESGDGVEEEEVVVEPEDVYQAKSRIYIEEKAKYLAEGLTYEKHPPSEGITIGSTVAWGRSNPIEGVVVGKSEDGKKWLVSFGDDDNPVEKAPQALKLIEQFREPLIWKLVEDSVPEEGSEPVEYGEIGLVDFDFNSFFSDDRPSNGGPAQDGPYLKLLQKLWHGDWKQQLQQVNTRVRAMNATNENKKNWRDIQEVSEHEWWTFHGILLSAAAYGKGGHLLWEKKVHRREPTMTEPINYGLGENGLKIMAEYRFKQIKSIYPFAFQDKVAQRNGDPWHMIMLGVKGFNKSRRDWIAASVRKVLDESMSSWNPQSTKTGGLPHLSFILRKPQPLGTEFKVVCCAKTGIMLVLEIQRGKLPMQEEEYSKEFGGTAACTFRLAEQTAHCGVKWPARQFAQEDNTKEIFNGDSWFSSVITADGIASRGHEYVGALKSNHSLYPKEEIEKLMENWPSGACLVFECTTPVNRNELLAIGYKYNARKVLCFVTTKNAGSTKPGEPYVAKFNDAAGNVAQRNVPRPAVLSDYFNKSNAVDAHNQGRQGCLALERRWVTQDAWFRLAMTIFGMTVTDCWKAYKYALHDKEKTTVKLVEFADRMAYELIHNKMSTSLVGSRNFLALDVDVTISNNVEAQVSPLTVSSFSTIMEEHCFVHNTEMEHPKNGKPRPRRRTCVFIGCKKVTPWMCSHNRCRQRHYKCNGHDSYGYFYCDEHKHHHWADAASGNIYG